MASPIRTSAPAAEQSRIACIYVIGGPPDVVKVGFAVDLQRRLAQLQTASPHRLTVLFRQETPAEDAAAVETQAHWILRDHRRNGEWFEVTVETAAAAIRSAHASVREGTARAERRGAAAARRGYAGNPLAVLYRNGTLDVRRYEGGIVYQRALAIALGSPDHVTGAHRRDAELLVDVKRWVTRANAAMEAAAGAEAMVLTQALLWEGHRLHTAAMEGLRKERALRLIAKALAAVADQVTDEPWMRR